MGTTTQMIEIIKQIPDYQSLSPQQIQDYLAIVEEVPNQKLYDGKAFEDLVTSKTFTLEEVNILLGTMKASPLFEMAFISMSTGEALEFYSDARQGLIRQLAAGAGWSDEFRDRVLALGRTTQARYLTMGLFSLPTLEQIEDTLNQEKLVNAARARLLVIQATRQKWDHISQHVRSQIETGQIESAQVVATVSQLWSE